MRCIKSNTENCWLMSFLKLNICNLLFLCLNRKNLPIFNFWPQQHTKNLKYRKSKKSDTTGNPTDGFGINQSDQKPKTQAYKTLSQLKGFHELTRTPSYEKYKNLCSQACEYYFCFWSTCTRKPCKFQYN